jgi:hypothetical protein
MPLESELFKGDARLNACLVNDAAHVREKEPKEKGEFVGKIQRALEVLDGATIDPEELTSTTYGRSTADAVLAYKSNPSRNILNPDLHQTTPDRIVGRRTIKRMDDELRGHTTTHQQIIDEAFKRSRSSLAAVSRILLKLAIDIDTAAALPEGPEKLKALTRLLFAHSRDVLVISRRLVLTSADPLSREFRDALAKVRDLVRRNSLETATIDDRGTTGRCAQPPGFIVGAATVRTDPEPRVSVCTPFFTDSEDFQRDRLTHEWFHLLGLGDNSVTNTAQAFTNANTLAQIVAFLHDRFRQVSSDGRERAIPPLPMP